MILSSFRRFDDPPAILTWLHRPHLTQNLNDEALFLKYDQSVMKAAAELADREGGRGVHEYTDVRTRVRV